MAYTCFSFIMQHIVRRLDTMLSLYDIQEPYFLTRSQLFPASTYFRKVGKRYLGSIRQQRLVGRRFLIVGKFEWTWYCAMHGLDTNYPGRSCGMIFASTCQEAYEYTGFLLELSNHTSITMQYSPLWEWIREEILDIHYCSHSKQYVQCESLL